jgi:hypothetical protein
MHQVLMLLKNGRLFSTIKLYEYHDPLAVKTSSLKQFFKEFPRVGVPLLVH